jgi:predicted MFS family arabinose efflux permease
MMADRYGARRIMVGGVLIYILSLVAMYFTTSPLLLIVGPGIGVGVALSCTGSNLAMTVTSRTVSPLKRSVAMGSVSAIGSLGLTLASPLAQSLISSGGWQLAMIAFLGLAAVMVPAAFFAGGADRIEVETAPGAPQSIGNAVKEALGHSGYVVMAIAFFVCGLQLVFITTHLPTYLAICGVDPTVGAQALGLIGLFNVAGSYLFGWLGGRYSKRVLLGGIYVLRSLFITAYFITPPTATSTLIFAAAMGTLWLGVIPLVSGLVVQLFGLRYMATISGIAFFSHQVGSFFGSLGGGLIYQWLGSYDRAWQVAVVIGLIAGSMQMMMNTTPSARIQREQREALAGA